MCIYQSIGALLTYPDQRLAAALPEILAQVRDDDTLPMREREALVRLTDEMAVHDAYQLQEDYVACFDRGRATSLHLFEHVHGESRERGPAMIDLREQYLKAGLAINPGELPDYLPVFLEYVAHLPARAAREQLREIAHILQDIHSALVRRRSAYAAATAALIVLAGEKVRTPVPDRQQRQESQPANLASAARPVESESTSEVAYATERDQLDAEWAEQPAFAPVRPGACGSGDGAAVKPLHYMPRSIHLQQGAAR